MTEEKRTRKSSTDKTIEMLKKTRETYIKQGMDTSALDATLSDLEKNKENLVVKRTPGEGLNLWHLDAASVKYFNVSPEEFKKMMKDYTEEQKKLFEHSKTLTPERVAEVREKLSKKKSKKGNNKIIVANEQLNNVDESNDELDPEIEAVLKEINNK